MSVSTTSSRPATPVDHAIETLYNHPSVKIIAFTSNQPSVYSHSSLANEPTPGSLPPSSQLERTIAVGSYPFLPPMSFLGGETYWHVRELPSIADFGN